VEEQQVHVPREVGGGLDRYLASHFFDEPSERIGPEPSQARRIVGVEGGIVKADVFRATMPVATLDAATSAKALSDAFVKVATDLVIWTCSAI
jgi:hypothetical protein